MDPFVPLPLPLPDDLIDWGRLAGQIGRASRAVGKFSGTLEGLINPGMLISPLARKEAMLSARIEGTITTMDVVVQYEGEAVKIAEQVDDIREIINYREALLAASAALEEERPLSRQLMREIHHVLLDSVRGEEKGRGQFRTEQNYVASGAEITYAPPDPVYLNDHLENLEEYLSFDEKDPIVQAAIVHAQFELIHPFMDGNGRLGRMLIPLFLSFRGVLPAPYLYLSEYFDEHRDEYINGLEGLSKNGEWQPWIEFFLDGITTQAEVNLSKGLGIHTLYESMKRTIDEIGTTFSMRILDGLFRLGVFRSSQFIEYTKIPEASALRILRTLRKKGILRTIQEKSGRQPAIMAFAELLNLVEGHDII